VLEYVDTPSNKCVSCNGSYPTDDLTACGNNPILHPPTTASGELSWDSASDASMATKWLPVPVSASARYLYGCLQENSVGRCNGCDYQNGFYMKFDTMCWKDAPTDRF
jgi:hypothetical protein